MIKLAEPKKVLLKFVSSKKVIEFQKASLSPSFLQNTSFSKNWKSIWGNGMPVVVFCKNEIMKVEKLKYEFKKVWTPLFGVSDKGPFVPWQAMSRKPWRSNLKSAALTYRIFLSAN